MLLAQAGAIHRYQNPHLALLYSGFGALIDEKLVITIFKSKTQTASCLRNIKQFILQNKCF